jgi:hypothetical protein
LPNAFDDIEDRSSLLLSDSVAKNTAEQPDVVPQRPVLSRAFDSLISYLQFVLSPRSKRPQRAKAHVQHSSVWRLRRSDCDQRPDDSDIFSALDQVERMLIG